MTQTKAYSASEAKAQVLPSLIVRRPVGPQDVQISIEHCGVCHTDIHFVNNDWGMTNYPVVPGHEIVGRVTMWVLRLKTLKLVTGQPLVAWLDPVAVAPIAKRGSSSTA